MVDDRLILARKLNTLFPDKSCREQAAAILSRYGEQPNERERFRVQLAVLKLAGDDLEKIAAYTTRAKEDYRDVLAWAEYPMQSKHWSIPEGPEKDRLRQADRDAYQTWLDT